MKNIVPVLTDFVALVFADNPCYTTVLELDSREAREFKISVNLSKGTWTALEGKESTVRTDPPVRIAEARRFDRGGRPVKEGVIGVFNRHLIDDLDSMVHASHAATERQTEAEYN